MDKKPTVSIVVPVYPMDNARYFLERNLYSISNQFYTNYEIIISDNSDDDQLEQGLAESGLPISYYKNPRKGMAYNTNFGIDKATGELVKILFQDDYFYDSSSLEQIVKHFTPHTFWLATGCTHSLDGVTTFNDHKPYYSESDNTIGSPSVITFRREIKIRFDPNFRWVLDLDFYKQLYQMYGKPKIFDQTNVVIGVGTHQETSKLSDSRKAHEHQLLKLKYEQHTST